MLQATLEYENGAIQKHSLEADESKKSVYWLKNIPTAPSSGGDNSSTGNIKSLTIAADDSNNFLIGGFQLQGMAKTVKVYVDDADQLIMSVRGIKSTRLQSFFKAQCVIPGGPRPVHRFVRLELDPAASIHQIRWTLRMRDDDDAENGEGEASNGRISMTGESNSRAGDGIGLPATASSVKDSRDCEDKPVSEPLQPAMPPPPPANEMLQSANALVGSAASTIQQTPGVLSAPAVASLTQHMADLASAMRELTATIKSHQRFLEQQHQRDHSHSSSEQEEV